MFGPDTITYDYFIDLTDIMQLPYEGYTVTENEIAEQFDSFKELLLESNAINNGFSLKDAVIRDRGGDILAKRFVGIVQGAFIKDADVDGETQESLFIIVAGLGVVKIAKR